MKQVAYILLATAATYATSISLGRLLERGLRARLDAFTRFVAGSALLSAAVFAFTAAGLARKSIFLGFAAVCIVAGAAAGGARAKLSIREFWLAFPAAWKIAFWGVYLAFSWLYLSQAMAPEASADGLAYHVGLVSLYAREQHFPRIETNFYASFPQAIEMLFLFAFSIGKHSAAAMVEFLFLAVTPFGILAWARRAGKPAAGVIAALLFYAAPVVGRDGTVAYVDAATAAIAFALFTILERPAESRPRQAALAGFLAGFGFAAKYTQVVGILFGAGVLAFLLWRDRQALIRCLTIFCGCALLMPAPWLIKNAAYVGNPVSPFFNRWFPNPYVSPSFETDYLNRNRNYAGFTRAEAPLELTVRGGLDGPAGPMFLLAPVALLAVRVPGGGMALAAAAAYLAPGLGNMSARLLVPAFLFIALAMALALERWPRVAGAVVVLHAVSCWPPVTAKYARQYAWRIEESTWAAALRRTPQEDYLRSRIEDYDFGIMLDAYVPPGARVFTGIQNRAYQPRELVAPNQSEWGARLAAATAQALSEDARPTRRAVIRFAPVRAHAIRLALESCGGALWTVSELRVFLGAEEVLRSPAWRLRAQPNPWQAPLAFDNSPITAWNTRDYQPRNAFVQIDFGREETVDRLTADAPPGLSCTMHVDAREGSGAWKRIPVRIAEERAPYPERFRRAIADELKADGVFWIATTPRDPLATDLMEQAHQWGAVNVAHHSGYRLWRLE